MFLLNQNKRPLIENSQIISVANTVREDVRRFNGYRREKNKPPLNLTNEGEVLKLIEFITLGTTINLKQEVNGVISFSAENKVNVTYSKSNLGRGFIFWFVCNICNRRARYLYIPASNEVMACRLCHRLSYKKQNETKNERKFDNLFK